MHSKLLSFSPTFIHFFLSPNYNFASFSLHPSILYSLSYIQLLLSFSPSLFFVMMIIIIIIIIIIVRRSILPVINEKNVPIILKTLK